MYLLIYYKLYTYKIMDNNKYCPQKCTDCFIFPCEVVIVF